MFELIKREYVVFILTVFFYLLFGCPTANFEPFSRGQPHKTNVNHCVFFNYFDARVTGSLVTKLVP